jgi:hypothetical protein
MSRTFYRQPINEDMADPQNFYTQGLAALNNSGYGRANFFGVKHIFCPVGIVRPPGGPNAGRGHIFVVVISPMARAETISTVVGQIRYQRFGPFLHLIALHLGRDFNPSDWRMRFNRSTTQAVGDTSCGIYFGANCMSIAFGYTLNHAGRPILNRTHRMVSEVLHAQFDDALSSCRQETGSAVENEERSSSF